MLYKMRDIERWLMSNISASNSTHVVLGRLVCSVTATRTPHRTQHALSAAVVTSQGIAKYPPRDHAVNLEGRRSTPLLLFRPVAPSLSTRRWRAALLYGAIAWWTTVKCSINYWRRHAASNDAPWDKTAINVPPIREILLSPPYTYPTLTLASLYGINYAVGLVKWS